MVNLDEIFYVTKVVWKYLWVFFLSVGYLTFIFAQFWIFPTSGSGDISGFPAITYFSGVYPAKFGNLFFWSYSFLEDDLWRKKLEKCLYFH
jgi:hypothetical protein